MGNTMKTVDISGLEYKIGRFGYAYYFNNGEWKKSEKHPDFIRQAIESDRIKQLKSSK